jgi:hypothetical protein
MTLLAFVLGIVAAIITFIITWLISDYFIPPRYNWAKSAFSVVLIKLGMAGGVAFIAFAFVSNLILKMIHRL